MAPQSEGLIATSNMVTNLDCEDGFQTKQFQNPRFGVSPPPKSQKPKTKTFTRNEVAKHNNRNDAWFIIHDKVYDLTSFLPRHPGGYTLMAQAGNEATPEFEAYHPKKVKKWLSCFYIGDIVTEECRELPSTDENPKPTKYAMTRLESDFVRLREKVEQEYLETDYTYYYIKFGFVIFFFLTSAVLVAITQSLWTTTIAGLAMFLTGHQAAFIGHDALHNSIASTHFRNGILGAICTNLFNGTSASWWRWSHDVHHLNTNSADHDLDITHLPVFCLSEHMFGFKEFDFFAKLLIRIQTFTYFPIMTIFARPNLHIQSIIFLIKQRTAIPFWIEIAFLSVYWAYYSLFLYLLPNWQHRALFIGISYICNGLLHMQITLSHWALPMHKGITEMSFVEAQVRTSQNIITYWWNDWLYGGLNYQIEHHLFPRVPRNKLRTIREKYVIPFCREHDLPYHEVGFWEAVFNLLCALDRVSSRFKKFNQK